MDDELQQLEAELKQLNPVVPSRALESRIARELAVPSAAARAGGRNLVTVHWLGNAALPIAAALAILALAPGNEPPGREPAKVAANPRSGGATLKPVAAEKVLYATQDEGLVTLDDGTTARRERLSYVDTITWKNPQTNASLTWSVPREEVRVVPVNFQ